jgi:PAS domain-containing protein
VPGLVMNRKKLVPMTASVASGKPSPLRLHPGEAKANQHARMAIVEPLPQKKKLRRVRSLKTSIDGLKEFSHVLEQLRVEHGTTFLIAEHLDSERLRKLRKILSGMPRRPAMVHNRREREALVRATRELRTRTNALNRLTDDMSALLNSIHIPIFVLGKDAQIRYCTRAAKALFNGKVSSPPHMIADTTLADLVPNLKDTVCGVVDSTQAAEREFQDRTGHWHLIQIQPLISTEHTITGAVVALVDIDARKRSELHLHAALRESEERLRHMMTIERDDEFFIIDPGGHILNWVSGNDGQESYRKNGLIGKHFSFFYSAEDFVAGKPMRALEIAEQTGRYEEHGRRLSMDGLLHRTRSVITAIRDADGNLTGFSNVTRYLD